MDSNIPPANLPIVKDPDSPRVPPSPPRALPPMPSMRPSEPPRTTPVLLPPKLPVSAPALTPTPTPSAPSAPLKSFIKTMEDDIKSAKEGSSSKGTEVIIPKTSSLPSLPETGSQVGPKPIPRAPLVRIGEAEKSSLLPGIRPPFPPSVKKEAEPPKAIAVPPKKGGFLSRTTILALVGLVLVGGGSAYWFFVIRQAEKPAEVTPTFTPRVVATPDPLKEIKNFFLINNSVALPGELSISNLLSLKTTILQSVSDDQILHSFTNLKDNTGFLKFSQFIKAFVANQQEELSPEAQRLLGVVEEDKFGLVISKQTDKFDESGKPVDNFPTERRIGFIVKVSDEALAKQAVLDWEINLPLDMEAFFELDKVSEVVNLTFEDNIYREIPIRFVNFPYPDRSIDYAIVSASDGNQYLVFANSRAQMYGIIDILLGFLPGF